MSAIARTSADILGKARRSILELHTVPEPDSDHQASDKVLAASIYSTFCKGSLLLAEKGSRKVRFSGGYNVPLDANPFNSWATVLDCGDIPVTSCVSDLRLCLEVEFDMI